jgi:CheY-like chemotaxis protein
VSQPTIQRVLVVYDDAESRASAAEALAGVGLDVIACHPSDDVLAAAEQHAPDAILIDVLLPDQGTQRVVSALRTLARFAAIPIVYDTASLTPHTPAPREALAALAVFPDLFDPVTRSTTTAYVWQRWAGERAAATGA